MKKTMIYIAITIVLIIVIVMWSNPLRRSEEHIRENMFKQTPISTSIEDVIKVIESNEKWKLRYIRESGYEMSGGQPEEAGQRAFDENRVIGVKSIRAYIGSYSTIFETAVIVFWAFDENSQLIDIAVRKDTDAL